MFKVSCLGFRGQDFRGRTGRVRFSARGARD